MYCYFVSVGRDLGEVCTAGHSNHGYTCMYGNISFFVLF